MPASADRRSLAWLALLALTACAITVLSGVAAALVYTDGEPALRAVGLTLQNIRPVHDTFAFAWVFLGGVTVVYFHMSSEYGPPTNAARRRMVWQIGLWAAAGVGILATLLAGQFSGREYMGYHPIFSLLILVGWLLFGWNYFERVGFRLASRPVYIYMWTVAIPLFVVAFLEGHLYLIDSLSWRPVRDIAIQWKSNGVLVGSFNLLAYGSLVYVAGRLRGDDRYAHSRTAYALFVVGVLNTFSNYGHHTFHLPQSAWIHWISFVVSMLEVVILAKVFLDVLGLRSMRPPAAELRGPVWFLRSATAWTFCMLVLALAISVPPLNALIHGTHVVVAHAMGSMIAIDSMILWAAFACMLAVMLGTGHAAVCRMRVHAAIPVINVFLLFFLASLLARGIADGWSRHLGPSAPDFSLYLELFPAILFISGSVLAAAILWLIGHWGVALLSVVWNARGRGETPVP